MVPPRHGKVVICMGSVKRARGGGGVKHCETSRKAALKTSLGCQCVKLFLLKVVTNFVRKTNL